MMKRILPLVLSGLLACNAFADNLKIGIVNLDTVIQKSPLAMSLNESLSNDFKPRQTAVNTAQQKLQSDTEQLIYNGFKLSADDRTKLQQTVNDDRRELDRLSTTLQSDIASAQAKSTQTLMVKLNAVISKIASDGHYDLIQTSNNVLYVNGAVDITQQVITQLK
jgi:outer membrane protein